MPKITLQGKDLYPTRYATAQDLGEKTPTLEIERIDIERMTNPRTHEESEKPVIYFRRASRGIVLGKQFAESIAAALGEYDASLWSGKRVQLYTTQTRMGLGVRARRAPNGETPLPLELSDDED